MKYIIIIGLLSIISCSENNDSTEETNNLDFSYNYENSTENDPIEENIDINLSCGAEDLTQLEFRTMERNMELDITEFIKNSTGETNDDCRLRFIESPDSCGPAFVYGIKGIDTLELEMKFEKLICFKQEFWENQNFLSVCDAVFPDKASLIMGECLACYGDEENGFNCPN